jgi:phosphatidyl-myo-inositol dimannoside synthase
MPRAVGARLPGRRREAGRAVKVLLLTWDYPPAHGGIQIWMFELARRLPDARVTVFARGATGDAEFDAAGPVRVRRLRSATRGPVPWVFRLCAAALRACLAARPDLIVCGHVLAAPAALVARRIFGVPYVVFTYGYEIRRRRRQRIVRRLLRGADMVIACSQFTRSAVLSHGVASDSIRVLYPGVDPERFHPGPCGEAAHPNGSAPTMLSVARLTELYKGHDTAIRALPLIKAKCPDARYVIAGDGPLRNYLHRLARSVGVERDVVFLGEVADEALADLYRASDLLVLLSRESASEGGAEGFGIVSLEAAACVKPVVAGRSGGLVDSVSDGETGILVDALDTGAAADAIVSVLRDPGLARRLGEAGRRRVLERFTWDAMAAEARRLFAEAVGQTWTPSGASSS